MLFTHALIGVLLSAVVAAVTPVPTASLVVAGAAGGLLPDADMVAVHRKTLHFPVGFGAVAVLSGVLTLLLGGATAALVFVASAAAAVHCWMDVLGGGKEIRPWLETDDRAVYDHLRDRWITARRVFYDGSKPDLVVAATAGAASAWLLPPAYDALIGVLLASSVAYVALRRRVTEWISDDYDTFSSYIQSRLP